LQGSWIELDSSPTLLIVDWILLHLSSSSEIFSFSTECNREFFGVWLHDLMNFNLLRSSRKLLKRKFGDEQLSFWSLGVSSIKSPFDKCFVCFPKLSAVYPCFFVGVTFFISSQNCSQKLLVCAVFFFYF